MIYKKIIYILSLLLSGLVLHAQDNDTTEYYNLKETNFINKQNSTILNSKNTNYSIQLGSSVSSFNGNTYFNSFVIPKINYKLLPKLNVSIGGIFSNSHSQQSTLKLNTTDYNSIHTPHFNQNYLFIQGSYAVNNKLTLSGTTFYSINNTNNKSFDNLKSYSFAADYKFENGMTFGIELSNSTNSVIYPFSPLHSRNSTNFGW